jgi:hypothetical protein
MLQVVGLGIVIPANAGIQRFKLDAGSGPA